MARGPSPVPVPSRDERDTFAFWEFQQQNALLGLCGNFDTPAYFVPYETIREYLTIERIQNLLRAETRRDSEIRDLRKLAQDVLDFDCLRGFVILTLIGRGILVKKFTEWTGLKDSNLPFTSNELPQGFPGGAEVYSEFRKIQRRFCVRPIRSLTFTTPSEDILPIKSIQLLGQGFSAKVYRIELHEQFNQVQPRWPQANPGAAQPNILVVKQYKRQHCDTCHREVTAYEGLGRMPNLVEFYGEVVIIDGSSGSNNIILEYADCGSLEDFWQKHPLGCTSASQFWHFWKQLLDIGLPLDKLHFGRPVNADDPYSGLQGFHHDIRPCNILVSSLHSSHGNSPFPYRFMLGDLGLVDLVKHKGTGAVAEDPRGDLVYTAPEMTREDWQDSWSAQVTQKADMWSLGCVLSEALVWSIFGHSGLEYYRKNRTAETSDEDGPRFHDGTKVLQAVLEQHQACLMGKRTGDELAPEINRMLRMLLAAPDERYTSKQFVREVNFIIELRKPADTHAGHGTHAHPPNPRATASQESTPMKAAPAPLKKRAQTTNSQGSSISRNGVLPDRQQKTPSPLLQNGIDEAIESPAATEDVPQTQGASLPYSAPSDVPELPISLLREWRESVERGKPMHLEALDHLKQMDGKDIVSMPRVLPSVSN
jgi:serine/threonine protein kinase